MESAFETGARIEGYPFIIRFKTPKELTFLSDRSNCIEGYPFIIRFKTAFC